MSSASKRPPNPRSPGLRTRLRRLGVSAMLLGLIAAAPSTVAEDTNTVAEAKSPGGAAEFSAFKLITERNIFNANRSAGSTRGPRETSRRQARVESLSLVGTLSYEKGQFAFFDGSSPGYKKVLKPDDKIAGYSLKCITPNSVRLEANGKEIEMRIGSQLRREDEGEWRMLSRSEAGAMASVPAANADSADGEKASEAAPTGGAVDASEVLKRLMKQREQELK